MQTILLAEFCYYKMLTFVIIGNQLQCCIIHVCIQCYNRVFYKIRKPFLLWLSLLQFNFWHFIWITINWFEKVLCHCITESFIPNFRCTRHKGVHRGGALLGDSVPGAPIWHLCDGWCRNRKRNTTSQQFWICRPHRWVYHHISGI